MLDWENAFPQTVHMYGFSPVWILIWTSKLELDWNVFLQIPHRGIVAEDSGFEFAGVRESETPKIPDGLAKFETEGVRLAPKFC